METALFIGGIEQEVDFVAFAFSKVRYRRNAFHLEECRIGIEKLLYRILASGRERGAFVTRQLVIFGVLVGIGDDFKRQAQAPGFAGIAILIFNLFVMTYPVGICYNDSCIVFASDVRGGWL